MSWVLFINIIKKFNKWSNVMLLIGENIHVISKKVKNALIARDEKFIIDLIKNQSNMDYIDLNVGPAKRELEGILPWLCELVEQNSDLKISLDTTNSGELRRGFDVCKRQESVLINSTSADSDRLDVLTKIAKEHESNLVALTMNRDLGIPKTADERLNLALSTYDKCTDMEIKNEKLFYDPLILPIAVAQDQAIEAINTIQMIKQSFDPPVNTIIGLSNISNGSPKELRPLINRVFACLAFGAGLDSAIIDALDLELVRVLRMLEAKAPESSLDKLYIELADMVENFGELEDIKFDKTDSVQMEVIKTAEILLNKKIYSHSYSQV